MNRPNKKDYILIDKTRDFMANTYANDLEKYCDELEEMLKRYAKGSILQLPPKK